MTTIGRFESRERPLPALTAGAVQRMKDGDYVAEGYSWVDTPGPDAGLVVLVTDIEEASEGQMRASATDGQTTVRCALGDAVMDILAEVGVSGCRHCRLRVHHSYPCEDMVIFGDGAVNLVKGSPVEATAANEVGAETPPMASREDAIADATMLRDGSVGKRRFFSFHSALHRIQAFFRGAYVRSGVHHRHEERRKAATTIAAGQRGYMLRDQLRRQRAATMIAAWRRGESPRRELRAHRSEKRARGFIGSWLWYRHRCRRLHWHRVTLRDWYLAEVRQLADDAFAPADRKRTRGRRRRRRTPRQEKLYADAARADVGRSPGPPDKGSTSGRRNRRRRTCNNGRPRNSRRRRRGGRRGRTKNVERRLSHPSMGMDTDRGALTMPADDPPGVNARAISRYDRYVRAAERDPRYREHLARTHPFRDRGRYQQPSRRHRNGRHRRTITWAEATMQRHQPSVERLESGGVSIG